jgi:signal transduction histidine kinase
MSFRNRLALLLTVILIGVQVATAIFAYAYLRHDIVEQGKRELASATTAFMRQLAFLSERVSDGVKVLALDYPLRAAIARHDRGTELSMLRNHGARIGAMRMMLVSLDGTVQADTAAPESSGRPFSFQSLLQSATRDEGTSLVTVDRVIAWVVVVPVRAPLTIGYVAAFIPVDSTLLEKLRTISSAPRSIALAIDNGRGGFAIAAQTTDYTGAPYSIQAAATGSSIVKRHGQEYLTASAPLNVAPGSRRVVAILDYSLEETLQSYRGIVWPMLGILALALGLTLLGTTLIVDRLTRPLQELATTAGRIAAGDYTHKPAVLQRDELGHLAGALVNMMEAIAEREGALKSAMESAESARTEAVHLSKAKSQFLANMSHELRTPLNAILGFSEILEAQLLGPIGVARYVEYARDIRSSGEHLLLLVDRMLDLAGSDAQGLALAGTSIQPAVLLLDAAELHRAFAEKTHVHLESAAPPKQWPRIHGDARRLKQAFANLIHNAIKFTPAGGHVRLSGETDGGHIVIRITDDGIGIARSELETVVKPFHRLRAAFDGQHQGAGLGLPFAKTIVELHGGTLAIDSEVGVGTTVTIRLPALQDGACSEAA